MLYSRRCSNTRTPDDLGCRPYDCEYGRGAESTIVDIAVSSQEDLHEKTLLGNGTMVLISRRLILGDNYGGGGFFSAQMAMP